MANDGVTLLLWTVSMVGMNYQIVIHGTFYGPVGRMELSTYIPL